MRGRIGPYSWECTDRPDEFRIQRDGSDKVVTYHASEASVVEEGLRRDWEKEKAVAVAVAAGEPTALCELGWHRDSGGTFFRWMGSGRIGVRLNYWFGLEPSRWTATKIAGIGPQAVPWTCSLCGRDVPAESEARGTVGP